jgi:hypothetical protein
MPGMLKVIRKAEQAHYTEEDLTIPERLASLSGVSIRKNTPLMNNVTCFVREPGLPRPVPEPGLPRIT